MRASGRFYIIPKVLVCETKNTLLVELGDPILVDFLRAELGTAARNV